MNKWLHNIIPWHVVYKLRTKIFIQTKNKWYFKFIIYIYYNIYRGKYLENRTREEVFEFMETYISKELELADKRRIHQDIIYSHWKFGASIDNYFQYEFYKKSDKERSQFITEDQQVKLYLAFNPIRYHSVFREKNLTYERFKEFYGREVIQVNSETDRKLFDEFVQRHPVIFIKPYNGSSGVGVRKEIITTHEQVIDLFDECVKTI